MSCTAGCALRNLPECYLFLWLEGSAELKNRICLLWLICQAGLIAWKKVGVVHTGTLWLGLCFQYERWSVEIGRQRGPLHNHVVSADEWLVWCVRVIFWFLMALVAWGLQRGSPWRYWQKQGSGGEGAIHVVFSHHSMPHILVRNLL